MTCAVIFGGNGFIGSFFAKHLVEKKGLPKVYVYDIEGIGEKKISYRKNLLEGFSQIEFVRGDVRECIRWKPSERVCLIANFAAIHREPGHAPTEYYETNLLGAENVCRWAEMVNCERIIFSSSIAPYGVGENAKSEYSLPIPTTPYGGSKLVAEKIHANRQAAGADRRHLLIVRPGVVFGPGEGGNVSRLIRAVRGRYFAYVGNRNTRKAGIYVKELCNAVVWISERSSRTGELPWQTFL